MITILEPGDVFVLPAGHWHYVLSEANTVMVNLWLYRHKWKLQMEGSADDEEEVKRAQRKDEKEEEEEDGGGASKVGGTSSEGSSRGGQGGAAGANGARRGSRESKGEAGGFPTNRRCPSHGARYQKYVAWGDIDGRRGDRLP